MTHQVPRVRVFVGESSPISSQLMADALARDSGIEVAGFGSQPTEILKGVSTSQTDVLLVSARLQEQPSYGLVLLRELKKQLPRLKAVVLLDSSRSEVVIDAFRSGASGVFCRNTPIDLLRKCVLAVQRGQVWANSEELGFVLSALASDPPLQLDNDRLKRLSKREKDVVQCLIAGLTNREIAQALAISQHTVKNYMFKIFEKLGVSNRVELVFQVLSRPNALGINNSDSFQRQAPNTTSLRSLESIRTVATQLGSVGKATPMGRLQPRSIFDTTPQSKAAGLD